jgi:CubicO group peptidase (beta-lactamase class C family)
MAAFPAGPESQVTLANWRKPPFNRWAFQHVRELIPSREIAADPGAVRALPSEEVDFSALTIGWRGETLNLRAFEERTDTDGLVVLHKGRIVHESYDNGAGRSTPHILMSVSKSVLGLLFGILADRGVLDPAAPVTQWTPELRGTAYEGATLRDLLDMRAGVSFDENYLANAGPIIAYRKAQGWDPPDIGDRPSDLRSFYAQLNERDGEHAGRFHYVSPNTDLLGWVIERATGKPYADLVSECLWRPMGAERDAYITVDRLGAPRCAGGLCSTVRDLARLGLLFVEGGSREGVRIAPSAWIDDILHNGDPDAWRRGDFVGYFPDLPIHYRSKWYVLRGRAPLVFGVGVFGQNVFIDPTHEIVIAKVSSHALPMDSDRISLTTAGVLAMRKFLTG